MNWEELKIEVLEWSNDDYLLPNVLVNLIHEHLGKKTQFIKTKITALKLVKELMLDNLIIVYFVKGMNKNKTSYKSIHDIENIIKKINDEWDDIGSVNLLPNQLIWIKSKKG